MSVTHQAKAGALLTGAEWVSATIHTVAITHAETSGQTATDQHAARTSTEGAAGGARGAGAAGTCRHSHSRDDHVHPSSVLAHDHHGAAQHTDITRTLLLLAADAKLDVATAVNLGASANLLGAVAYADAATQGAFWTFEVPADWTSGVITIQPVWSPGATDGTAHTVRWSMTCKTLAAGVTGTAAGTTVAFTG